MKFLAWNTVISICTTSLCRDGSIARKLWIVHVKYILCESGEVMIPSVSRYGCCPQGCPTGRHSGNMEVTHTLPEMSLGSGASRADPSTIRSGNGDHLDSCPIMIDRSTTFDDPASIGPRCRTSRTAIQAEKRFDPFPIGAVVRQIGNHRRKPTHDLQRVEPPVLLNHGGGFRMSPEGSEVIDFRTIFCVMNNLHRLANDGLHKLPLRLVFHLLFAPYSVAHRCH